MIISFMLGFPQAFTRGYPAKESSSLRRLTQRADTLSSDKSLGRQLVGGFLQWGIRKSPLLFNAYYLESNDWGDFGYPDFRKPQTGDWTWKIKGIKWPSLATTFKGCPTIPL